MESLLSRSNEMIVRRSESKNVSIECCLCGDVGLKEKVLKCTSCLSRYQHTYCSRLYPKIDLEHFSCEWCICKVIQMVATQVDNNGLNEYISDKMQSISACKQINALREMQIGGGGSEEKSDLFVCVNGRKQCQVKEKPKLQT